MVDEVWLTARGKPVELSKHAVHAMNNERPPIRVHEVVLTLERPDDDSRHDGARRRFGDRTVVVRYQDDDERLHVRTVSATRSR